MKFLQAALLALSLSFPLLQNTALAGYAEGYAAYKKQDFATALREFEPLASQGHAQSQFSIGLMYAKGQGVAQDDKEAVKWFRLAANQGNATFQFYLGSMYAKGQGVAKNETEAVKWFRLAANQGDANAQNDLGVMYAKGQGVAQDDKEAVKWYRLAANQGHAGAKTNVAYHEGRRKEQITESKRKAEEAVRMEEEVKRIEEETARNAEEAKRKADEAARIEEEARRKAEESARIAEEARLKAEEVKRLEEEARRKTERNVRIVSWIAAVIGLAGVLIFFVRRRKHGVASKEYPEKAEKAAVTSDFRFSKKNCLKCGYQRTSSDIGPEISCPKCGAVYSKVAAAVSSMAEQSAGLGRNQNARKEPEKKLAIKQEESAMARSKLSELLDSAVAIWERRSSFEKVIIIFIWLSVTMPMQSMFIDLKDRTSSRTSLPSCQGGFIAECMQRNGFDPRMEGDPRFQELYKSCSSECR